MFDVSSYFRKIHPCFPILDEAMFWNLWRKQPERISSALICQIYAISLVFWQTDDKLNDRSRPDMSFAWNQAVVALRDDLLAPGMTTLHASLLAITGRPTIGVTGNVVKAGSTVTLAHSLGLHRNPTAWRIGDAEKGMRVRLWWAVLVHDYWSSLAHGTPPNIQKANYDVPLPSRDSTSEASVTFHYLCSLSRILGDLLPLVYTLAPDHGEIERTSRRLDCDLDDWEHILPQALKVSNQQERGPSINGESSLWFCYLTCRLLVCRLTYRVSTNRNRKALR